MIASPDTFGYQQFGQLELGDIRRTRRLAEIVDLMCRHPGSTLPDKRKEPKDLRAFYRLMDTEEVTHTAIIGAHADATRQKIAGLKPGSVVLQIHDATELDYTTKLSLEGQLGQIGQGTHRGSICHNSLAVLAGTGERSGSGEVLGLVSQILHHRADVPEDETVKEKRERENRESRLWVEGAQASGAAPPGIFCVDVSDSLSDTFEYLSYEVAQGRHFVLRARENRRLTKPLKGENYLYEGMRKLPPMGQRTLEVLDSPGRQGRTTEVQVSFAPVMIHWPGKKLGEYENQSLEMWAVRVWEKKTPAGEEALEWILLTNVAADELAQAQERVDWYECRPLVEEYHKGMKTGCGIELLQFTMIERLEPAIAVLSVIATQLLRMRDAARAPDADIQPATAIIGAEYVDVLVKHFGKRLGPNPSIKKFFMHVARLGGHQNRKCDGFPGWITLWRGWMKLESMVDGYRLARKRSGKT